MTSCVNFNDEQANQKASQFTVIYKKNIMNINRYRLTQGKEVKANMPQAQKKQGCPGCTKPLDSEYGPYCPTCQKSLDEQQCLMCGRDLKYDQPYTLCPECEQDMKEETAIAMEEYYNELT